LIHTLIAQDHLLWRGQRSPGRLDIPDCRQPIAPGESSPGPGGARGRTAASCDQVIWPDPIVLGASPRRDDAFAAAQTPQGAAAQIAGLLETERPAFRVQTSDAARGFTAVKLTDGDGSAVLALTGGWVR
jgi:hypothetical protein